MEKNILDKCQSDEEASSSFTFLTDPKGKSGNDRLAFPNFSKLQHRMPTEYISDVITPKKLHFQMDLFSPCKEDEITNKVITPRQKRRASDSHTGLTPGISELQPSKFKKSRTCYDKSQKEICESSTVLSPMKGLIHSGNGDEEMKPSHVFANSPGSPAAQCLLDAIDVTPASDQGEGDFLKRKTSINMRRCRSLELRKRLNDMTNTPPSGFKKSLFKKPAPISDVKSSLARESNPDSISPPSPDLASSDMKRCQSPPIESADHQRIKKAVDILHNQELIADGSRHYCLPLVQGKHSDLNNIDHETMAMLICKKYPSVFDKLTVIDCRYPYEYSGGHIQGAINIYTEEAIVEFLNKEVEESKNDSQTHILVFHCEFSSHRGPNLLRHLRNRDRQINLHQYPQLQFPEIYCLFGGYKDFYSNHPDLCEPSSYTPMVDEKYSSELRHFRAKAKSWAAGDRLRMKQQQKL